MRVISYMSETGLGLDIFIYSFAFAVILLLCGVNFRKRILSAISYYLGIISILYFLVFNNIDAYSKLIHWTFGQSEKQGFLLITTLIDVICVAAIIGIYFAIRRLKKDIRYSL